MQHFSVSDPDYDLWALLVRTKDEMHKARQKELARYNISPRHSALLFVVEAIGHDATPAEISRWLAREPHTISDLVARMERRGLVRKMKDLDRKNQVRVELTEKGREAYYQSIKRESIHEIMSSLSEDQRQQLISCLLTLVNAALKALGSERTMPFPPFPPLK